MDEIEELRTRVADQEKALSDGILGIEYWKQQAEHFTARCAEQGSKISELSIYSDAMEKELRGKNEELQTRLSTLKEKHDCLKHNYRILDEKREIGIDYATKEIDRLTIRLSTLEKSILDLSHPNIKNILSELNQYKSKTVNVVAFHKLEDRLSNLLKASEGMERALERIVEIPDQTDYEEDTCGQVNAMYEKATKALADFRAVKEGK